MRVTPRLRRGLCNCILSHIGFLRYPTYKFARSPYADGTLKPGPRAGYPEGQLNLGDALAHNQNY
jgi:hypothetical protein